MQGGVVSTYFACLEGQVLWGDLAVRSLEEKNPVERTRMNTNMVVEVDAMRNKYVYVHMQNPVTCPFPEVNTEHSCSEYTNEHACTYTHVLSDYCKHTGRVNTRSGVHIRTSPMYVRTYSTYEVISPIDTRIIKVV